MTKAHTEHQGSEEEAHGHRTGYDPVQAAARQTNSFNWSWLKNGESMTLFQRVGFTIFSLLFFASGLYLLRFIAVFAHSSEGGLSLVFTLIFGLACLFFLVFGILGLRNVLRFKR